MRTTRRAALAVVVLGTATLGACTPGGTAGAAEAPTASTASPALDDAATCTAFGDVLTIVENADLAAAEGRMAAQEQDGWHELATRVLDRLPGDDSGDSAVRAAIGALQDAAPAAPAGTFVESTGVGSPAWDQAQVDLADACDAAGVPLAIMMFTGG